MMWFHVVAEKSELMMFSEDQLYICFIDSRRATALIPTWRLPAATGTSGRRQELAGGDRLSGGNLVGHDMVITSSGVRLLF